MCLFEFYRKHVYTPVERMCLGEVMDDMTEISTAFSEIDHELSIILSYNHLPVTCVRMKSGVL